MKIVKLLPIIVVLLTGPFVAVFSLEGANVLFGGSPWILTGLEDGGRAIPAMLFATGVLLAIPIYTGVVWWTYRRYQ